MAIGKQYIYSSGKDRLIKQWKSDDLSLCKTFDKCHENDITGILVSANDQELVSVSLDGNIYKYKILNGEVLNNLNGLHESKGITCTKLSHDGKYIFTGGRDNNVKQIDFNKLEEISPSFDHNFNFSDSYHVFADHHQIGFIDVDSETKYLYTASTDRKLRQWSIKDRSLVHDFGIMSQTWINTMKLSPDNKFIIIAANDKTFKQVDINLKKIVYDQFVYPEIIDMEFENDVFYTVDVNGFLRSISAVDKSELSSFGKVHNDKINCMSLNRTDKFIVFGGADGNMEYYDI